MTTGLSFTIYGKQITQGSKKSHALVNKATGQPVMKDGRVVTITRPDNPDLLHWRQQVASVAATEMAGHPLILGPVWLGVCFVMPRPKGHFGTGRNAAVLKATAPEHHTKIPDSLKLCRAIEDSLSGIVWQDDAQVCEHVIRKQYGEQYRTEIKVVELARPGGRRKR